MVWKKQLRLCQSINSSICECIMNAKQRNLLKVSSMLAIKSTRVFGKTRNVCEKFDIRRSDGEIHTKFFHVPTPSRSKFRIDQDLEPSRYLFVEFDSIHDSYYIGINEIEFYDEEGNTVPYTNIQVDGNDVDNETVQPAFPNNGWWAVVGEQHSLVFDFGEVTRIKYMYMWCANAASTPKHMKISDSRSASPFFDEDGENIGKFDTDYFIQLGGNVKKSPKVARFITKKEQQKESGVAQQQNATLSCKEVIKYLNENPPLNGFESFLTSCGSHYVFYRQGLRSLACNYYLGKDHVASVRLLDSVTIGSAKMIDEVAKRAMTLQQLRAVRALIVSNCVKHKWKSSWDGSALRPEDVNLYDLNKLVILPLTKKKNCAFKELFPSGEAVPTYYVSHWWGEKVLDFILCCEYHAMSHNLDPSRAKYWVCAYANRQHDLGADLGSDPSKSSFNVAMKMAGGVFLVIDPKVVVTSRIWVDYELFRTIETKSILDIGVYNRGKVHLIANKDLENETPYQKNRRESKFPFEEVCAKFLTVELYQGQASMEIDRVRILNVMSKNVGNLNDRSIVQRISLRDSFNPKYLHDMSHFMRSDSALRAEMASKTVSVALSTANQSLDDFYGHNLIDIISTDQMRTELVLDDLVSLDGVTDEVFLKLFDMVGPNIDTFVLNVCGCKNLTDACLINLTIPQTLVHLTLNVGYAKNITNDAVLHLATLLPQTIKSLDLNVSGFKIPDGSYAPPRYNNHLERIASNMPPNLERMKFATHLESSEGVSGLKTFVSSLPRELKEFTIVIEAWEAYRSDFFVKIVNDLPTTLEKLSITQYGGYYFNDDDLHLFAEEIKTKYTNLKEFYLHTRSNAEESGGYLTRTIESVDDLHNWGWV